jgi:hypothetical protein
MVAALRAAGRVAKAGAPIVIQVWGRPERCSLEALKGAIAPFLPPPDPTAPRGSALWQPGALEKLAADAGLSPRETLDVSWSYEYPNEDGLSRGMLAAGGIATIVGPEREDALRKAIVEALGPYRNASGGYSLENDWHCLVASV